MARNQKDPACRQKNLLIPTEICVRYERLLGIPAGEKPTKAQVMEINEIMIDQIGRFVRHIALSSHDYQLIAEERAEQERKFLSNNNK